MTENMLYAVFFFPAAAAVLIFAMKYVAEIMKARARAEQDEDYRVIAAQSATAQARTEAALTGVSETLADIQRQLARIAKILKDVE